MKRALRFTLPLLPVAAVAGYFVLGYQLELLDTQVVADAVAQLGSLWLLYLITILQTVLYTAFCGFFGCLLAQKIGILHPLRIEKKLLLITLTLSLAGGILFSLDYWTFGAWMPELRAGVTPITLNNWVGSLVYGGIVEELMLRLFFMSLVAVLLWKLFEKGAENPSKKMLVLANVVAALLFAAGHLPATVAMFGSLTPMLLIRCFLLNGGFGILFGWLYRKYGIQYAMISHAALHLVSKLIWTLFA